MTNKLLDFKGKPLIEIPKFNFLKGEFGKAVYDEYRGRVKKDYNNASALKVLSYRHEVIKGTNPFAVALVGKIIGSEGLRVATQADLERALKVNALPLREHCEDTGLVLRSEYHPNPYLAKNLMAQIKARNPKAKMPAMIPLSELELVVDENAPYKLGFKIKENAQIFYNLSVLYKEGKFSSKDIDEKIGLPTRIGKGNRTHYARDSGVSILFLDGDLDLNSRDEYLAGSSDAGRIVVVSGKCT